MLYYQLSHQPWVLIRNGGQMLSEFSLVGLFILIVLAFALMLIFTPTLLGKFGIVPHKPSSIKSETYECGLDTVGPTWIQYKVRYYYYALLLIIFDIIILFIYPWAVELKQLGANAFWSIVAFLAIAGLGYIYAWRKGALEWK
jgi:NADH-quinone oxidoreductase subunit A